ncbi:MAG: low molecular weight protein arginine phosphatase [Oceanipulchritudo sp.]
MEGGKKVITVVCTGNVCRSPMAEFLLRHALRNEPEPLSSCKVISAGVSAFPGDPPSRNAVEAMRKVKIDLQDHRSRPLTDQLLDISDLILTMTSSHQEIIRLQNPDLRTPVYRFREWMDSGTREVPDPFGGSLDVYLETRDSLAEAIPSVLHFLRTQFTK